MMARILIVEPHPEVRDLLVRIEQVFVKGDNDRNLAPCVRRHPRNYRSDVSLEPAT